MPFGMRYGEEAIKIVFICRRYFVSKKILLISDPCFLSCSLLAPPMFRKEGVKMKKFKLLATLVARGF